MPRLLSSWPSRSPEEALTFQFADAVRHVNAADHRVVGHDGYRGRLYYVACAPSTRQSGVGCRMVDAAEAWLRERGVVEFHLMVRGTNTEVVAFHERLGFERMPRVAMARWLRPRS